MPASSTESRSQLRFCKAFFEVTDFDGTRARLDEIGAACAMPDPQGGELLYWWRPEERHGSRSAAFLIRVAPRRLILEGASARQLGHAWRRLNDALGSCAEARVAAGDDLRRFLPKGRRSSGDRPETWSRDYEGEVLREFYAGFARRWLDIAQPSLGGRTPRQAAAEPGSTGALHELLHRLERVEAERTERGMPCFAVEDLHAAIATVREGDAV